jgi:hypothetical protein
MCIDCQSDSSCRHTLISLAPSARRSSPPVCSARASASARGLLRRAEWAGGGSKGPSETQGRGNEARAGPAWPVREKISSRKPGCQASAADVRRFAGSAREPEARKGKETRSANSRHSRLYLREGQRARQLRTVRQPGARAEQREKTHAHARPPGEAPAEPAPWPRTSGSTPASTRPARSPRPPGTAPAPARAHAHT